MADPVRDTFAERQGSQKVPSYTTYKEDQKPIGDGAGAPKGYTPSGDQPESIPRAK